MLPCNDPNIVIYLMTRLVYLLGRRRYIMSNQNTCCSGSSPHGAELSTNKLQRVWGLYSGSASLYESSQPATKSTRKRPRAIKVIDPATNEEVKLGTDESSEVPNDETKFVRIQFGSIFLEI